MLRVCSLKHCWVKSWTMLWHQCEEVDEKVMSSIVCTPLIRGWRGIILFGLNPCIFLSINYHPDKYSLHTNCIIYMFLKRGGSYTGTSKMKEKTHYILICVVTVRVPTYNVELVTVSSLKCTGSRKKIKCTFNFQCMAFKSQF